MTWTIFACETVTGKVIGVVDGTVKSWARGLGGGDSAQVELSPGALTLATRDRFRNLLEPKRMSLVLDWDGTPMVGCPIVAHQWSGKSVTITATDVRKSILAWRLLTGWTGPWASQVLNYTNWSLGSIATQVTQFATSGKAGSALPITFPSLEGDTDPSHVRNYNGYALKNVDGVLTDLTGVIGGPDIDFLPQWVDATRQRFQYAMRVGTKAQPQLYSPTPVLFNASVANSPVVELGITRDASKMATTMWSLGAGEDVSTLMSLQQTQALVNLGWPLLEGEDDDKDITDQGDLDQHAQGVLATYSTPTEQWALKVNGAMNPRLGTYLLGDVAIVTVRGHLWIPDGKYPMRIVGINGDSTSTVTLSVQ